MLPGLTVSDNSSRPLGYLQLCFFTDEQIIEYALFYGMSQIYSSSLCKMAEIEKGMARSCSP